MNNTSKTGTLEKGTVELIIEALKGCNEKQLKMIYQFILGLKKGR